MGPGPNKLIPEIIQKPFEKNTAVLLANALYLKNKWAVPFDPLGTYPMTSITRKMPRNAWIS